jgi:WD40 repeat protein/tRNA A-37 threonylcarbamoyl transferase component Bud32
VTFVNPEPPKGKPAGETIRISETDAKDTTVLQPFSQFGEYTILTRLGEGGMGIVYGAKHRALNRRVALKMMRSGQWASADETMRFRREAEAAAKLNHPNIVPIYEIGKHEGLTFLSMQYVEGETLSAFNAGAKARDAEWIRACAGIMAKVARAVHHAHEHLVLHRDLKPGNILLDEQGQPHVTDFGLAKLLENDAQHTLTETILGTPEYMPPEQAMGSSQDITTAADIYSLGAVLYHLLTGKYAFKGRTPIETIDHVRTRAPVAPRSINPIVPRDLEVLCLKCLEKEPGHRFSSAAALADELERWLAGRPIQSRRATSGERLAKWVRRNPRLAGAIGSALAIALMGGAGVLWQWQRAERHRLDTDLANMRLGMNRAEELFNNDNPSFALAMLARVLRNEPGNRTAANRLINALNQRRFLVPVSPPLGEKIKFGAFTPDGRLLLAMTDRAEEALCVVERNGATALRLPIGSELILAAAMSGDGRLIAVGTDRGARVWNAADGTIVESLPLGQPIHAVHFRKPSPSDGTALALAGTNSVMLWKAGSRSLVSVATLDDTLVLAAFAPGQERVAVATENGHIAIISPGSASACRIISNAHTRVVRSLEFNPDARLLVSGAADGMAKVWSTDSGELLGRAAVGQTVLHAEFNHDSTRIVTASRNDTAQLWDWKNGQPIGNAMLHLAAVNVARFSPDGRWILTASDDGVTRLWSARDGAPGAQALKSEQPIADAAFSRDGDLILAMPDGSSGSLLTSIGGKEAEPIAERERIPATGNTGATIPASDAAMFATAHTAEVIFSDQTTDGRRVATASLDRTARIWDRAARRPLVEALIHDAPVNCVRFSPDGTLLVTSTTSRKVRVWDSFSGQPITDWFLSSDPVSHVQITTDNAHVVTAEGTIWRIGHVGQDIPPWLPQLAEAVAGIRYVRRHISEPIAGPAILELRTLAHSKCNHPLCDWLRDLLHELPQP